jgi:hypothetical protein
MTFKITSVDMDGYNGRDFHPEKEDEGTIVTPLSMFSVACDAEGEQYPTIEKEERMGPNFNREQLTDEGRRSVIGEIDGLEEEIVRCWRCATRDGRLLDLMDHEVEIHES